MALDSLRNHYLAQEPMLTILGTALCLAVGAAIWVAARRWRAAGPAGSPRTLSVQMLMGLVGLYFFLITGIPSFVNGVQFTASCLTYLSSIGLCVLLALF